MMRKDFKALLLAGCMTAVPALALAQEPPKAGQAQPPAAQQQQPAMPPAAKPPAAQQQPRAEQPGSVQQPGLAQQEKMQILAQAPSGSMMGSDLRGTRIYTADDQNVGSVDNMLIDKDGKIVALIVGVGGFLGIGAKDVAIPWQAFEIPAGGAAPATVGERPAAPTTTAPPAAAKREARQDKPATMTINPQRLVLRGMTKAELEAAPEFRWEAQRVGEQRTERPGAVGDRPATQPPARQPAGAPAR